MWYWTPANKMLLLLLFCEAGFLCETVVAVLELCRPGWAQTHRGLPLRRVPPLHCLDWISYLFLPIAIEEEFVTCSLIFLVLISLWKFVIKNNMFFEYDVDTKVLELSLYFGKSQQYYLLWQQQCLLSIDNTIQKVLYSHLDWCKPKMKNLSHNFLEKYPFSPWLYPGIMRLVINSAVQGI